MLDSNVSTYIDKDGNVQEVGSGGSEYANTSEIVDNAITLTSTSTLDDLVTQILAQKTKVVRAPWDDNLKRILPSQLVSYSTSYNVTFKVFSIGSETEPSAATAIQCLSSVQTALLGVYRLYEGYIYSMPGNSYVFTGWQGTGEEGAYPIGSIYMSTSSFPPSASFGGTWEQIKDVFLLAAGDTYTAGSTGGSANAVVVSHNHRLVKYGSVLAISVPASESETSAGFVSAPTGQGLWGGVNKATTGINSTGEDGSGKNMPPYLTVYMWKRIA